MKRLMLSGVVLFGAAVGAAALVRRGMCWGSTPAEQMMELPGDAYLVGAPTTRTVMTRAISITAAPEVVWPWLAQMGRGAGWYSYDGLDNGGLSSARHIVSWIPEPKIGDATAIGWLRHVEPVRGLTWWLPRSDFAGAHVQMVTEIRLDPEGNGSRLIIRMSGTASGITAAAAVHGFEVMDSIMAVRQLKGIKERAETLGSRTVDPERPEDGRDQFQVFEAIWASGGRAGVRGREGAAAARQAAVDAGVFSL